MKNSDMTIKEFREYVEKTYSLSQIRVETYTETEFNFKIITDINEYSISSRITTNDQRDYLGCIASQRLPLPGETWTRSSDLTDGPLSLGTWSQIIEDIAQFELIEISCQNGTRL